MQIGHWTSEVKYFPSVSSMIIKCVKKLYSQNVIVITILYLIELGSIRNTDRDVLFGILILVR